MAACILCNRTVSCSCSLVQGKYCSDCYSKKDKKDVRKQQSDKKLSGSSTEDRSESNGIS